MNFEKFSFIGKIDKITSDFNLYFEQIEAFKNVENDPNQLLTPEYYLQSIINRKRPETAVPCTVRNNRKNSFEDESLKNKTLRVKTSTNKRESLIGNAEFNNRNTNQENMLNQNNFYSNFANDHSDLDIVPNYIDNTNEINNPNGFNRRFNSQINNQIKNLDKSKTRQILNEIRRQDSRKKKNDYGFKNIISKGGIIFHKMQDYSR